jgi:hypothetical protein
VSPGGHLAQRQLDIGTFFGQQDAEPQIRCSMKSGDLYRGTCALEELVHRSATLVLHVLEDVGVAPEGHRRVGVAEHR